MPQHRFPSEDEPDSRGIDDIRNEDSLGSKFDRLVEKFDSWKEETERRFESLQLTNTHDVDRPTSFGEEDDAEWGDFGRGRHGERGAHPTNPNLARDGQRGGGGRDARRWEPMGNRMNHRQQPLHRSITCWDPPQRSGYDQPHHVKMKPPRFDGSNAAN